MNVSKEVYTRIKNMLDKELSDCKYKLRDNKYKINQLSKDQRTLKAEIGKLYELRKNFK